MLKWPAKDPGATKDYDLDWTAWLGSDTIASSTWAALPAGSALVMSNPSFVSPITKVWLSGGTLGQTYVLENTITTAAGETEVRRVSILIKKQ
jgi:hypothetical protein